MSQSELNIFRMNYFLGTSYYNLSDIETWLHPNARHKISSSSSSYVIYGEGGGEGGLKKQFQRIKRGKGYYYA